MSGGSPDHVTTTQNTTLPSWLDTSNQYGVGQAQQLYQRGGPQYYPGSTVAPLSSIQEQYLTSANNLGANGNPTLNAANGYAQRVMGGQYLDPNSDPYLASTFNQAANAVQERVGSQFGAAGRNLEASIPVQNDQMNQLATQIYGGNYQAERQNQQQMVGMTPGLNSSGLANLEATAQAGALSQQQAQNYTNASKAAWDYNQNLPYTNLSNYMSLINSLQHGQNSTATQPVFQNTAGNVLGGAMAGYSMGSGMSSSPYAGLIGAGIGAIGGYMS